MPPDNLGEIPEETLNLLKSRLVEQLRLLDDDELRILSRSKESFAYYIALAIRDQAQSLGYMIAVPIAWASKFLDSLVEDFALAEGFTRGWRTQAIGDSHSAHSFAEGQIGSRKAEPSSKANMPANNAMVLAIRITEEPLTGHNFATIISTLTELHTKFSLIEQGRFAELIEYAQTHNARFVEEVNLIITEVIYNSPIEVKIDVGIDKVGDALQKSVDAFTQAGIRRKEAQIWNQAAELDKTLKEQAAQSVHANQEQERLITARTAVDSQGVCKSRGR